MVRKIDVWVYNKKILLLHCLARLECSLYNFADLTGCWRKWEPFDWEIDRHIYRQRLILGKAGNVTGNSVTAIQINIIVASNNDLTLIKRWHQTPISVTISSHISCRLADPTQGKYTYTIANLNNYITNYSYSLQLVNNRLRKLTAVNNCS